MNDNGDNNTFRDYVVPVTVTTVAVLLIIWHLVYPGSTIPNIYYYLTLVALSPWLLYWLFPKIKSLEIVGLGKIEMRDILKVEREAVAVGLFRPERLPAAVGEIATRELPFFVGLVARDPNLALAGLRLEIENALIEVADQRGIETRFKSLGNILRDLLANGFIDNREYEVVEQLVKIANQVVHGKRISREAAERATEIGLYIISILKYRLAEGGV